MWALRLLPGKEGPQRKCSAGCLAREGGGRREEGVAWDGHRTEVLFFSPSPPGRVPDWLHAGAGAQGREEQARPACQLLQQGPGPRETHGSGPWTLREPFAGSSVHGKGRGTCTWLVTEEKVPHTNNQRHVWQPPCRPAHSPVQAPLPLPTPTVQVCVGALCPLCHAPSVLRPPLQASLRLPGASTAG